MTVLDLFSGIGGFSLGLERAGMRTVAFCEAAEFPRRVLQKHWPDIPIYEDVRKFHVRTDFADVFAGGFPCKQTSTAAAIHGKRVGLDGEDSGLWYEYLRLVDEGRPAWVIVENPPGVNQWAGEIQMGMEGLGYRVSPVELTASDYGLPHLRRRKFFVANRHGQRLEIARQPGSPQTAWVARLAAAGGSWLTTAPGTCGSLNGLPHRVDRVTALGNAVIPSMAETIGRAILKTQEKMPCP